MKPIDRLLEIMARLQEPETGCPWVIQQAHAGLAPYLIEEAYEAAETMFGDNTDALRDELGDILLQVVFHAQIAKKDNHFNFDDVAQAICEKLVRRYPTILGEEPNTLRTAEEVVLRWEEVKTKERGENKSILDGVSKALPALTRARKLKDRCAAAGWEWKDPQQQLAKVAEEVEEIQAEIDAGAGKDKIASEIGDLLFMIMDFARFNGVDAEEALRTTNARFEKRFRHMESGLKNKGKDFKSSSRDERASLWEEAKSLERKAS